MFGKKQCLVVNTVLKSRGKVKPIVEWKMTTLNGMVRDH